MNYTTTVLDSVFSAVFVCGLHICLPDAIIKALQMTIKMECETMSIYLKPILTACYVFPVLAALFTLPYIIRQYHKYGSILVLRLMPCGDGWTGVLLSLLTSQPIRIHLRTPTFYRLSLISCCFCRLAYICGITLTADGIRFYCFLFYTACFLNIHS